MHTAGWLFAGVKYALAASFCHFALDMGLSSSALMALMALLALHPLSLCLFVLISVNALVSTTSVDKAIGIGVPVVVLMLVALLSSERKSTPTREVAVPTRA